MVMDVLLWPATAAAMFASWVFSWMSAKTVRLKVYDDAQMPLLRTAAVAAFSTWVLRAAVSVK